ncbi:ester cyclase [Arenibacter sp. M-2]|uniref:ester cyclase n=1 Tax=Arenibacter sp. M-2 TaxID=3053612 RepID=UPI002571277F|nr:ester cyclase [Arenibacter sp. M-2]MDL5513035.1 ester cyclase [Arenibacter sp. M-2]
MENSNIATSFIEQIWNHKHFDELDKFIHPEFKDYSLPSSMLANKEGLKKWILATDMAFKHNTVIEDQITEGHKSVLRIIMNLKHIGTWRGIEATGKELSISGFRYFKIKEGKIIEHWALIDGESIENQLKSLPHGCEIKEKEK